MSANVPVAANCWVTPFGIVAVGGDKVIDDTEEVWKEAIPDCPSKVAVIVAVAVTAEPGLTAVASPFEPAASPTVAIPVSEEVHVANVVRFCWVLFVSKSVPVAAYCWLVPGAMLDGATGVTLIDATRASVSVVDPVIPPKVAVILAVPVVDVPAVTKPCEPEALLIIAIPVFDEFQVTDDVMIALALLEYVPIAVSLVIVPGAMAGAAGEIAIDLSVIELP